jgi:hypothetical protein
MPTNLQIRRGLQSALPTGLAGEPLFTTDTKRLYISDGTATNLLQGAATLLTTGAIPFSNANGKLTMSASNLYWDDTNNRLGVGTATPTAIIHSVGSVTASGAIARGNFLQPTLVAAANNDVLVGLDVAPTFTTGAFTGVTALAIRSSGLIAVNPAGGLYGGFIVNSNRSNTSSYNYSFTSHSPSSGVANQIYTGTRPASANVNAVEHYVGTDNQIYWNTTNTSYNFLISNTQYLKLFVTTGNLTLQNGGTFTDAGYRLDVNGTARVLGQTTIAGAVNASSGFARGTFFNQTLVATANNDTLYGIDINPTYTVGAFTGVTRVPLRIRNAANTADAFFVDSGGNASISASLGVGTIYGQANINLSSGNGNLLLQTNFTGNTGLTMFNATRNVVIQNGGTFTDAGYRLDVNGTTMLRGIVYGVGSGGGAIQLLTTAGTGTAIVGGNGATPLRLQAQNIGFLVGSTQYGYFHTTTGNFTLQNGGTFTDAGFRLDVQGNARVTGTLLAQTYRAVGTSEGLRISNDNGYLGIFNSADTTRHAFIQATSTQLILTAETASSSIIFNSGGVVERMRLVNNGNFLIGTTTDAGFRLDVNGSVRATGSISAASAVARGIFVSNTLIATANNDVLVGLDVAPTFTTGAFTNVQTESLVVRGGGNVLMRFKNANATSTLGQISATSNAFNLNSQAGSLSFTSGNTDAMFIYNTTRNVVMQNGGPFPDIPSAQLSINSTTRGFLPPRMTTTEKNAIASPAVGLVVYDTDLKQLCTYNGTWGNSPFYQQSLAGVKYFTDFDNLATSTPYFTQFISGAGAGVLRQVITVPNASNNQIGFCQYQTGTTATGYATHVTEGQTGSQFFFSGGSWVFETFVNVETLSNSLERFRFIAGFGNVSTNTFEGNGAFFTYDEGGTANGTASTPNWQTQTCVGSIRTLTTTTAVVTASAWTKLRIEVNAAGTSVAFYVNGTLVATHTTNIPQWQSAANPRGFNVKQSIVKTTGLTSRSVFCDYLLYENNLTTLR